MRHGSLFSGIGGFDLAAQWMGWTNVFHTEWNEFGQKVLKHHFPNSISYHDIIKTDFTIHRGTIDIITGGFPCQPFSLAGKRKGTDDERYLWHEMLRSIQQIQPTYVVAENVRGLLTIDGGMVFEQVCADLEAERYEVQPILLPAAGVNAPHRRDRIFIVAYANKCDDRRTSRADAPKSREERLSERHQVRQSSKPSEVQQPAANTNITSAADEIQARWNVSASTSDTELASNTKDNRTGKLRNESSKERTRFCNVVSGKRCGLSASTEPAANTNSRRQSAEEHRQAQSRWIAEKSISNNWQDFPIESAICGGNDGIPDRLDNITFPKWRNESIKAYGNAVVPQLILPIFQTIEKLHREKNT
jgi:DNA (cytosine-5)-methyltransferase 1